MQVHLAAGILHAFAQWLHVDVQMFNIKRRTFATLVADGVMW
ncbi:hypothetical protein Ptr902_11228 [Pyrenophora tritici-repentis]|nr:hypothetical protein Ptr902_11228 [Pyrenophora tritici-repentis]